MKELMLVVGFGAGLITGALLYKHSQDVKSVVNKAEKSVSKEMNEMKDKMAPKVEKLKKDMKDIIPKSKN